MTTFAIIYWSLNVLIAVIYGRFVYQRFGYKWDEAELTAAFLGAIWPLAIIVHIGMVAGDWFHRNTPKQRK